MENSTLKVRQDWDNDGFLRIEGAKTIALYNKLRDEQSKIPVTDYGIFFAFSNSQFEEGYKNLVAKGLIKDGDKIKRFPCGAFGTLEGMQRWMKAAEEIDQRIRTECDPYEVYLDEYNNHECCIDWDGDENAVRRVAEIFGGERTRKALAGRRFRACRDLDEILDEMRRSS